jgi:serine protease Do
MKRNRTGKAALLPLALSTLAGAGAMMVPRAFHHETPTTATAAEATAAAAPVLDSAVSAPELSNSFVDLAKRVTPAVVRIEVRKTESDRSADVPDIPEPFRQFFQIPPGGQSPQPDQTPYAYAGGTGFITSPDGYIVTNNHVVSDADEITVWFQDGRSLPAKVVGRDPTTDVAVIKVDAKNLPTLRFGDSSKLEVGQLVMAVGNPGIGDAGPLDYTVTSGIVSAKDRPLRILDQSLANNPAYGQSLAGYAIEDYIQTDAVINPGNSGGPLVDLAGNVIGMNSAIASTNGYYEGYGFAIPSDLVKSVASQLEADGRVHRARLGVSVTPVTPADADVYKLPSVSGVLVQTVGDDSPASGDLKPGDVIVALGGTNVRSPGSLQSLVAQHQPGERVDLTVYRDGKPRDVTVKLGEVPFHPETGESAHNSADAGRLGVALAEPGSDAARAMGVETKGALVVRVDPMGPAARAGIRPGDVVTSVDGKPVTRVEDLTKVLSDAQTGSVLSLRVMDTTGQTRIANVRVG